MRNSGYRKGPGFAKLAVIFLCVAVIFAAIWVSFELFGGLFQKEPEPQEPVTMPNPLMNRIIEELPKSEFEAAQFVESGGFIGYSGPDRAKRGIDVSDHQGDIDWTAVAADGVEFAMLRVAYRGYTEGTITLDTKFAQNVQGARANGIEVGVYFFSQALTEEETREEAKVAIEAMKGLDITYPVVFDWEDIPHAEARTDMVDGATLTANAKAFCQTVEQAGYTAGVYFNQVFGYQKYDLLELKDYVFWLAEYKAAPTFYYAFDFWQYTDDGTVGGIGTPVDVNLSFWQPEA